MLLYGLYVPYHPGKWKIVNSLLNTFRLKEYFRGRVWTVKRQGVWWQLHTDCVVQRFVYYFSHYEYNELSWLKRQIRDDWVFFDVGANFGYYSLLVSRYSGAKAAVYAFEPLRRNFEMLKQNRELNDYENISMFNVALSDKNGMTEFVAPLDNNLGRGHLANECGELSEEKIVVETVTLDSFVARHGITRLDAIKVDIEGAEMLFLRGAGRTLVDLRPLLIVECNPSALHSFGSSAEIMLELIHEYGYTTWVAGRFGLKPFAGGIAPDDYRNVICTPCTEPSP